MNENNSIKDKREFPRVPKNVTIVVKRLEYPLTSAKPNPAITKDVAGRGLCFVSTEAYEPGCLLCLEIELRGWQQYLQNVFSIVDAATVSKPLTAIGEVVWSKQLSSNKGYRVGVCFQDIYEDDRKAFQKYLAKITDG